MTLNHCWNAWPALCSATRALTTRTHSHLWESVKPFAQLDSQAPVGACDGRAKREHLHYWMRLYAVRLTKVLLSRHKIPSSEKLFTKCKRRQERPELLTGLAQPFCQGHTQGPLTTVACRGPPTFDELPIALQYSSHSRILSPLGFLLVCSRKHQMPM